MESKSPIKSASSPLGDRQSRLNTEPSPSAPLSSSRSARRTSAVNADLRLKENFAPGGILDSQTDSQEWLNKKSSPPNSAPSAPASKKRKVDNMTVIEDSVKALRAELEELRVERIGI
ncbi:hypothetical protein FPV67DRAFT_1677183 [Lyophyllum atratum]|nr:hypothetical protein FPV67DRAFT_1677183 [Lyophyllum atratum]